jgi:DNA-binding CsgD family transcriptional regulator
VRETEHSGGCAALAPLTLSPTLRPLWLSAPQRQVLRAYFPHWQETSVLPELLRAWVARSLASLRQEPPPHPLHAFTVESARGRLLVRCFPDRPGGFVILILVETAARPDGGRPWAGRLTARESEILHWITGGKRDREIAVILGVSPRTVGKHVEHILAKLKAPNRTAAVGAATR